MGDRCKMGPTKFNIYSWIVSGKQNIKISTPNKAFTNSDLYV